MLSYGHCGVIGIGAGYMTGSVSTGLTGMSVTGANGRAICTAVYVKLN